MTPIRIWSIAKERGDLHFILALFTKITCHNINVCVVPLRQKKCEQKGKSNKKSGKKKSSKTAKESAEVFPSFSGN